MRIRIFCLPVIIVIVITFLGCASTTRLKTESGETITAIYSSPESKGKLPAIIYNHGTSVRKLGYSEAANRYDVNDFVKALNKDGFVAIAPIRKVGRLTLMRGQRPDIMGGPPSEWNNAVIEGLEVINSALKFLKDQPNVDSERIAIIGFSEGGI